MLLKKLKICGFKSFAENTEIIFDRGITAIVGPNGSGKSNITDAIRWVLGEQNVRNLRGAKSADVIYAGGGKRPPAQSAEVTITFADYKGQEGEQGKDLSISRRLLRSGESEFYINRVRCRLKDIYDLLAGTGLGKGALSVISQNKIDDILNRKTEDRRQIFEECAGISKYKERKKEAQQKLQTARDNYQRLYDIFQEVSNKREPLRKEAEEATKYQQVQAEYRRYHLTSLLNIYEKNNGENIAKTNLLRDKEKEQGRITARLTELLQKQTQDKQTLAEKETDREVEQKEHYNLTSEIQQNKHRLSMLLVTREQTNKEMQKLRAEIQQLNGQDEERLTQQKNWQSTCQKLVEEEKKALVQQTELAAQKGQISAELRQLQSSYTERQEEYLSLKDGAAAAEKARALFERDVLAKREKQAELEGTCRKYVEKQKKQQKVLADGKEKLAELEAKRGQCQTELGQKRAEVAVVREELQKKKLDLQKLEQEYVKIVSTERVLRDLQENYEGFSHGVRAVLQRRTRWQDGIIGTVAELVQISSEYVLAIETALGNAQQQIIVKQAKTAEAVIDFLKRERAGRVTFLPLDTVQAQASHRSFTQTEGFIAFADELVEVDPVYRHIISNLLGRTMVADNLRSALTLAKANAYRYRIVTKSGEVVYSGGALAGGSGKRDDSFLWRRAELQALNEQEQTLEGKKQVLQNAIGQGKNKLTTLERSCDVLVRAIQDLSVQISALETDNAHMWRQQQEMTTQITALQEKCAQQKAELTAFLETETMQSVANFAEQIANLGQSLSFDRQALQEKALARTRLEEQEKNLAVQIVAWQSEIRSLKEQLHTLHEGRLLAKSRRAQIENDLRHDQSNLLEYAKEEEKLKSTAANLEEVLKRRDRQGDRLAEEIKKLKFSAEKVTEKIHQLQLDKEKRAQEINRLLVQSAKYTANMEQSLAQIKEEYGLLPNEALQQKLTEPEVVVSKKVQSLKKELQQFGPINENAVAEYQAIDERYKFMEKQLLDMRTAEEDLQQIVEGIDQTMEKQFKQAFQHIRQSFQRIFTDLFSGGQADIYLTEPQAILQSGVEIMAQPPDKNNQNLVLLSGGERTLTVIALLFAFLQYNPAPFTVLDEIDAALDEINTERFSNFLQNYVQSTQFIIVTHRKITMEAAEVLYGVTMQENGISRLLSIKLE